MPRLAMFSMWPSQSFSNMLAGLACIEYFEEHADLGCFGAGERFEDGDGIAPAAACGVGLAVGAQRRAELGQGDPFAVPVAGLPDDRKGLAAIADGVLELSQAPVGGAKRALKSLSIASAPVVRTGRSSRL